MSGETKSAMTGWTIDTLFEYLRALRETDMKAIEKAEAAVERRLEGMNEFRASLADQSKLLMPRLEAESRINLMAEQIRIINSRIDKGEGKGAGLTFGWEKMVSVVSLIGMLIAIYFAMSK